MTLIGYCRDLADINNDGRLTRDGFAVAMHLIQGKLAGKEIPASLPQTLIPPSMRVNGASPFGAPPPQEPVNLLWDDTPPPSASPVPAQTQSSIFPPALTSPHKPPTAARDPFGSTNFGVSCRFEIVFNSPYNSPLNIVQRRVICWMMTNRLLLLRLHSKTNRLRSGTCRTSSTRRTDHSTRRKRIVKRSSEHLPRRLLNCLLCRLSCHLRTRRMRLRRSC